MNKITVNVLSVINKSSKITKETANNKEYFVIRDVVPVVDDVVMNNGLYPKDEINKSYMSINGNLMPIGHPKVNGQFVSASNAKAINEYYGGAWAENVHKDNDKVLLDCHVDIEFAKNHEKGKQLLERLESMVNGEDVSPIHVSTGLILNKVYQSGKSKGKAYNWVATNMQFDHVAILLDEQGAATPSDGVGMFVNSDGEFHIENANLIDSSNYTNNGIINKFKSFFTGNSDLSFSDVHSLLSEKLNTIKGDGAWTYIDSVFPNYLIYESQNKKFKQTYLIDENQKVNFVGEAVEVKKTIVYDEIKTNGENQTMKEKILQALNAKGIKTDGLNDEQLLAAFNKQASIDAIKKKEEEEEDEEEEKEKKKKEKESKEKTVNSEAPDWAKALTEKIKNLETAVNATIEKELTIKREAVKDKFNMTQTAVNALSGEPLDALYAQCISTTPINGSFANNSDKNTLLNMEAPE